MKRIASFEIDHTKLKRGLYVSRVDGDVVSYDIRICQPNAGDYLANGALHTIEHLLATFARNGAHSDQIVYAGPMGCRTGFYLLARDSMPKEEVIALVQEAFAFIAGYEGKIPGSTEPECGNYREHDLAGAKKAAAGMCEVLRDWTPERMAYEK